MFQSPARYTQGKHATARLGAELRNIGLDGPALILSSSSPARLLDEVWAKSLGEAGIHYSVEIFGGECSPVEVERVCKAAVRGGAAVIIGAGGGKVLDTSRAVAAALQLPSVNCPTVASSDAPCSALSVLYSEDGEFLEFRFYPRNPDLVLVDTAVIAQAPPRLLVAGIGDALATWWEAKAVREANSSNQLGGKPTMAGTALAELCYELLLSNAEGAKAACEAHVVTPALENLIEANTLLSGLGFESGGLAAAHSVHNGLTAIPETHPFMHGEKVAFGLVTELVLENRPRHDLDQVLRLARSVGLPMTLAEIGIGSVTADVVATIAAKSVAEGETIHHEPFSVDAEAVGDAIVAADRIGTRFLADHP
ncbi:MAG: glycerol dehydrogenase [Acidimicrobiales bacterium]|nr:glycerol dehydrogenase [Acidimicrobiales bacterium]